MEEESVILSNHTTMYLLWWVKSPRNKCTHTYMTHIDITKRSQESKCTRGTYFWEILWVILPSFLCPYLHTYAAGNGFRSSIWGIVAINRVFLKTPSLHINMWKHTTLCSFSWQRSEHSKVIWPVGSLLNSRKQSNFFNRFMSVFTSALIVSFPVNYQ
mgnify:CR=1 FL=1